ncbi:MAG: family oxidoreductase [Phenylobacterium sp.]|nr:family oxidoreductase [Phenylobacterium sp.]
MGPADEVQVDRRAVFGAATLGMAAAACAPASQAAAPPASGRRRFDGKIAIITGATSGIGRATALRLAAEGAKVAFCGRREVLGHEVEAQIRKAGGTAAYIRADVREPEQVRAFVDGAAKLYGGLDVAVNNAGIGITRNLAEMSLAEWTDLMNTNLRGVFLAMQAEIPHLIARGGGTIVVTSSSQAFATREGSSAYSASKRALIGLVQAAALEYAPRNIRINAIAPGTTDTAFLKTSVGMEAMPDPIWEVGAAQWAKSHVPGMRRLGRAEEQAAAIAALASDDFTYMTGATMLVDGGKLSAQP